MNKVVMMMIIIILLLLLLSILVNTSIIIWKDGERGCQRAEATSRRR
jgi:regulator of protease activity HflC (stomatin/prohibitin superfamily)